MRYVNFVLIDLRCATLESSSTPAAVTKPQLNTIAAQQPSRGLIKRHAFPQVAICATYLEL